jgi:predicted dehydrogenase
VIGFRTVDDTRPLRIVTAGAGAMGKRWIRNVLANGDVELVGVADAIPEVAEAAVVELGADGVRTSADAVDLALELGADALVNVTIPAAHHPVTSRALREGIPVLGEKPAAATVAEALRLVAVAEATGELFVVSQSRRYNEHVFALRHAATVLGDVGYAGVSFFRAPHFGGFREEMAHPLLLDMAIHPFDSIRYVLGSEPVSVTFDEFNPTWSWYDGDAAVAATFVMDDGARFAYTASWAAPGLETSWNGEWRLSGARGSAAWDGETRPRVELVGAAASDDPAPLPPADSIAGSLADFVSALRTGVPPLGEVHENVMSLLMVEAAVRAAETDTRVRIDDVLAEAHAEAIAAETDDATRAVLESWPSPREALLSGGRLGAAAG